MRDFTHHTKAVYALDFVPNSSYLLVGSDDMSLSYNDFSIGKTNYRLNKIHSDFIRTVRAFSTNQSMILSASYDKMVKVWDVREPNSAKIEFKHDAEVEDAKIFNSDTNMVSVGGRLV